MRACEGCKCKTCSNQKCSLRKTKIPCKDKVPCLSIIRHCINYKEIKMNDIVEISVIGGVVDVSKIPPGVTVHVKDYDVDGSEDHLLTDEDGDNYILGVFQRLIS